MCATIYERAEHKNVRIDGGFWKEQQDKIHNITVFDVLEKFENDHDDGLMKNYEMVVNGESGKHIGPPWYDGLICETIRGISDIIAHTYDRRLDDKIEEYTQKISAAQDKSAEGYINTYVTLICPDKQWGSNGGSLIWQHELYNLGCLVEAGIHYYNATDKTSLLKCSVKAANCMCGTIGCEPKKNIVPAHSLPEEAMIKLYRLFKGNDSLKNKMQSEYGLEINADDYLNLSKFWMDHRGVHHNRASMPKYMGEYAQDHCKITEQSEAVGHAVRAALMYTGLAALGIEVNRCGGGGEKYLNAAKRIWDNIVQTKLHISGGIGAVHNEERFGYQYDLPNNAYLETCAGVALMFFAGEMHRAYGDSHYFDVFERTLYNNVLPCLSVDGKHYFYENPLTSDGNIERWSWHGCPCCPPMFLKVMGSLSDYIYSFKDNDVYVNLHIGSRANHIIDGNAVTIIQKNCGIPYEGTNAIEIKTEKPVKAAIKIRIPEWTCGISFKINEKITDFIIDKGYAVFDRTWNDGDCVDIEMKLPVLKVQAHPYVRENNGKIALQRGPLLYCLEGIDNESVNPTLGNDEIFIEHTEFFGKTALLKGKTNQNAEFTAIPYYLWCNRGKTEMRIWLDQEIAESGSADINDWDQKLYKINC